MKLWHLLLHNALGLEEQTAWFFAIIGLVITVRGLLLPFFWFQYKSGRSLALMLPIKHHLDEQLKENTTPEVAAAHAQATKKLNEEFNYRPAAGCVPPLIQIPAFMGLYRVIVNMARPREGLTGEHQPIGFLSKEDVASFLNTTVNGVPLPAYRTLDPKLLSMLGTTSQEVASFVGPILVLAVTFTTLNMSLSIYRNFQQLNYDSKSTINTNKMLIVMLVLMPIFLLNLGWNGPLPVAIVIYWFANNLWTLSQQAILHTLLSLKYPLTQAFHEFKAERKALYKTRQKARRRRVWRRRRLRAQGIVTPWRIPQIRSELRAMKQAKKKEKAEAKAQKKAISAAKAQAQRKGRARKAAANPEASAQDGSPQDDPLQEETRQDRSSPDNLPPHQPQQDQTQSDQQPPDKPQPAEPRRDDDRSE